MHEPGINPDFKEEWKKLPKNTKQIIVLGSTVTAMLVVLGTLVGIVGQFDVESYSTITRALVMAVIFGIALLWNRNVFNKLEAQERTRRVKEGLRSTWDDEDHDELEKRVKALEEKIGRD